VTTAGGLAGALFSPVTAATNKLIREPVNQLTGGPQTVQEATPFEGARRGRRDEVALEDVYETERRLFYVACTRARDRLLVTGIAPGSEFLADLRAG
jgi:superfamily I DNA/RNA helicase